MKKVKRWLPIALTLFTLTACFGARESTNPRNSGSHLELQKEGITIDAKYNADLDNLIPGYKIVTVGVTNNSVDLLKLNPLRDHWDIVDATGTTRRAYNSLRIKDPTTFSHLPDKVRELIEYPVAINMGYSETIDIFFPSTVDLTNFRSISYFCAERKQNYDMLAMDESREVPSQVATQAPPVDPRWATPKKKK